MKALFVAAVAALSLTPSANADFVLGRVRPFMRAELTRVEGRFFPTAYTLSINKEDGKKEPVSFTVAEDTGIRCIQAPCPSQVTTEFTITEISPGFHSDVVRYEAIEVLKNIPANVRIAPRRLLVTESSMELVKPGGNGFMRRTMWDVEIRTFPNQVQIYTGQPEYLLQTADFIN